VFSSVVVDVVVVVVVDVVLVIDESMVLLVVGAGVGSTGAGVTGAGVIGAGVVGAGVGLTSPVLVDVVVSFRTGMLLPDGDVAL
jgi:hypothetical protein